LNEAEIFITAILGVKKFFLHFRGNKFEYMKDWVTILGGKCTYLEKKKGKCKLRVDE